MTDYINKIITLVLIFVMLVLGPLTFSYLSEELTTQRLILNEVTNFLDKVTDQRYIRQADLDDFYLAINSHGKVLDARVEQYKSDDLTDITSGDARSKAVYYIADDFKNIEKKTLDKGDIIKVTVEEVAISAGRRLIYFILRIDEGRYRLTMSASVR